MLYLIIGLPGGGKTTLSKELLKIDPDGSVHDDFIPHIFNGKLVADLHNGKNVFAPDPRLCKIESCESTIMKINQFVKNVDITLVLFPNNSVKALKQAKYRQEFENGKNVDNAIEFYSKIYNPSGYEKFGYRVVYL
jgi:hypothetical protein